MAALLICSQGHTVTLNANPLHQQISRLFLKKLWLDLTHVEFIFTDQKCMVFVKDYISPRPIK